MKLVSIALSVLALSALAPTLAVAKTAIKASKAVSTPWAPVVEEGKIILRRQVGPNNCTLKVRRGSYLFRLKRESTWVNLNGLSLGIMVIEPWIKTRSDNYLKSDLKDYYKSYIVSPREREEMYVMATCGVPSKQMVEFMMMGTSKEKKKKVAKK